MIPYPVKGTQVTAQGFRRDEPSLFEKILRRYEKWHEDRADLCGSSVIGDSDKKRRQSAFDELISRSQSKLGDLQGDSMHQNSGATNGLGPDVLLDSPDLKLYKKSLSLTSNNNDYALLREKFFTKQLAGTLKLEKQLTTQAGFN